MRAGGAGLCVSAWLTKARGCGEQREGRGGSAAPGDPGCGLQLALATGLKTPPLALWRLGSGVGGRPLGLERGPPRPVGASLGTSLGDGVGVDSPASF